MITVPKDSPAGQQAIREINATLGYDITAVWEPDWWRVALIDGQPEVIGSAEAMRAIARFAPRPDAVEITEEIIAAVEEHFRGGDR